LHQSWTINLQDVCLCAAPVHARFYFLSNDELLEILAEAKDPLAVQPFVKKCFEAVKELVFEDGHIVGLVSGEGEKITFNAHVDPVALGRSPMFHCSELTTCLLPPWSAAVLTME
jgi:hypothetical protein